MAKQINKSFKKKNVKLDIMFVDFIIISFISITYNFEY